MFGFIKRFFRKRENRQLVKDSPQIVLKIDDFKSYVDAARGIEDGSAERLKEERKRLIIEAISEGVKGAVVESLEKTLGFYAEETNKIIKEVVKEEVNKAIDSNVDRIAQRTVDLGAERIAEYVRKAYGDKLSFEENNREGHSDKPAEKDSNDVEDSNVTDSAVVGDKEESFSSEEGLSGEELELSSEDSNEESIRIYDSPNLRDWKAVYLLNAYPVVLIRLFLKSRNNKFVSGGGSVRRKIDKFFSEAVGSYAGNLYGSFSVACPEKFDINKASLSEEEFLKIEKDLYSDAVASVVFVYSTFLEKDFSEVEEVGDLDHLFVSIRDTCNLQTPDEEVYREFFTLLTFIYIFAVREFLVKRFQFYSVSHNGNSSLYKSRYDVYRRLSLFSHLFSSFFVSLTGLSVYKRMNPEFSFFYSVLALFHDFGKIYSFDKHDSRTCYGILKDRMQQFFENNIDSFQALFGKEFDFSHIYSRYEEYLKKFFIASIESHHFKNRDDLLYDLDVSKDSSIFSFISFSMENTFIADKLSRIFELRVFNFMEEYSLDSKDAGAFFQDLFSFVYKEKGKGGESFYSLCDSGDLQGYRVSKMFREIYSFETHEDVISSFVSDLKTILLEIQSDPRVFSSDGVSYSESFGVIEIPLEIFYSYLYSMGWFHSFGYYKDKEREVERSYDTSLFILSRFLGNKSGEFDASMLKNLFILMSLPSKNSENRKIVKIKTDLLNYLR